MPASVLQKKTLYFFAVAAILILALILFPFLQEAFEAYVARHFGATIGDDGSVFMPEQQAGSMTGSYISLVVTILKIVKVVLAMALVIAVVRFVSYLVTKTVYRKSAQGEISSLLRTVVSIIIYIVAFFIIFQTLFPTVELTALFTGSTIIGIVVGLALQDTLGNLFAGLALQADQSFQVGDVINVGTLGTGVVESISWRGVKIRTFQNKLLVIGNAAMGKEAIEVAPKSNLNARLVFFNTVYIASPARTAQLIREAIRTADNVSQKIRPIVRIRNLAADGIDWEIKYWCEDYSQFNDTDALVRQRVWYVFNREKIDFAYPTRTVYFEQKPIDRPAEEVANTITERLNNVSIFAPLSEEEITQLADASTTRVYAPGEAIVRKGQEGNSMFVVINGSVKVQIPELTYQKTVNTLHENDFFGEMSLLTGEPRTATVLAIEETEVLKIDKSGLKPIFESNPKLAETVFELIEDRKILLDKQAGSEGEEAAGGAKTRKGVVKTIRKFFGLKGS